MRSNVAGYRRLVLAVQWLAAEPDRTLGAVAVEEMVPDELGNDLDTWFEVSKRSAELSEVVASEIWQILEIMDRWSGSDHADFWTPDAVRSSPVWAEMRDRARTVLGMLGEPRIDEDLAGRV